MQPDLDLCNVFLAQNTSGWTSLNGYKLLMYTGSGTPLGTNTWANLAVFTEAGAIVDASGFGVIPTGCLKTTAPFQCTVGTIDSNNDAQADSFGRSWEIAGNFTSHANATPGNDAARWRDSLLFTNPTYFCDTSLVLGHIHKQDTANFLRTENTITSTFNNLYKRELVENVFGIYYGLQLYGAGPAGFGSRYFASIIESRIIQ
jgi:hypothetical protein